MASKIIPDSVRECFSYDPETGVISRTKPVRGGKVGPCGAIDSTGYIRISFERRALLAHRLAWFLAHDEQPDVVDHINGNGADNRLCNLRNVTHKQNSLNRKQAGRGVRWHESRWRAYLGHDDLYSGKNIMLAHFHRYMAVTATYHPALPPPE